VPNSTNALSSGCYAHKMDERPQLRHDDIVIRRRFGEDASTHAIKQIYAVTYPGHTDQGAERRNYGEAEEVALGLAQEHRRSVWFEEYPHSGKRTLVKSFRDSD